MALAKPVVLPSRTFETQTSARKYFSEILNQYKPGARVSGKHATDLRDLLPRHPKAKQKIGVGIDHFTVRNAEFGTKCFGVVRTDGTYEQFSYAACVAADPD